MFSVDIVMKSKSDVYHFRSFNRSCHDLRSYQSRIIIQEGVKERSKED